MPIVEFARVPPERWDAFVTASPDGWPFALTSWRKAILSVDEWQLRDHSFALTDDGQLIAVVPLQLDRRNGMLGMSGWGGCGPVVSDMPKPARAAAFATILTEADRIAKEIGATALHFSIPPVTRSSIESDRSLDAPAFQSFRDLSGIAQIIDLAADEPALWRGLSETARQTVRKAEKAGLTVERAEWPMAVDDYYRIHAENYRRTGVTPHPKAYFSGIAHQMAPADHSILWGARTAGGEPIAFHNDMHFGEGAWYHTGCSSGAALGNGANYLLFWRALLGAKAAGRRWYDCGEIFPQGGSTKQDGLTLFKTRFGGQPRRFVKAKKDYASDGRLRFGRLDTVARLKNIVRRAGKAILGA